MSANSDQPSPGQPSPDWADLSGCSDLRQACRAAYWHYIRAGPYPDLIRGQRFQRTVLDWMERNAHLVPDRQEDINLAIDAGCQDAVQESVDRRVQELLDAGLLKRRNGELATTQLGHDLFEIGVL